MKKRNSLAILCSACFVMALTLTGCFLKKKSNETVEESESPEQGESTSTTSQSGGTVQKWTITFDSQGGSQVAPIQVENGKKATKPADPTRTDYTFDGWFEEQAAITQFDFNTAITSNWTLYAGWTYSGGGEVTPPEPPAQDYDFYVSLEGNVYGAQKQDYALSANQTAEYRVDVGNIVAGQSIAILNSEKVALTENYGAEPGDNNVSGEVGSFTIHNNADDAFVLIKTWESGWTNFYVSGYSSGEVPPEPPVGGTYYVSVGGVEAELVTNTGATLLENQTGEYYAEFASVQKDAALVFYDAEKNAITESIGPDSGDNNGVGSAGSFHIHNDAENVTVYFKTWQDGGHSFWVTGYEAAAPVTPDGAHGPEGSELVSWYIVGQGSLFESDWGIDGGVQLYSNPDSPTDKGCILSLTIESGNVFKVTDGTTWYGYDKVDQYDSPANLGKTNFSAVSDGFGGSNIQCDITGVYDIYVNGSGNFWIQAAAEA